MSYINTNPLRYQVSEYDCGPTCILNAISLLHERETIPPELIKHIWLFTMDAYNEQGEFAHKGTSEAMMVFLSQWLTEFGKTGKLSISAQHICDEACHFGIGSPIIDTLKKGGVVVQRLWLDVRHYVLLTGMEDNRICVWDPYFYDGEFPDPGIEVVRNRPCLCNRIIEPRVLACEGSDYYNLGQIEDRESLLIFCPDDKN